MLFEIKTTKKFKQLKICVEIPVIKRTVRLIWHLYHTPDTWTWGYTSRCQDGKHVLFFDFDNLDLDQIEDEINYLQKYYRLSNAFVFECEKDKSYHVVILDKFSLRKAFKILSSSNSEFAHVNSVKALRGKEWILRAYNKGERPIPKFLKILYSPYNFREISFAHKIFLEKHSDWKIKMPEYFKEDNNTIIPTVSYNTGNRVSSFEEVKKNGFP